jgi:ketosteroid isomerase-like protein
MRGFAVAVACLIALSGRVQSQKVDIQAETAAIMRADRDFNQAVADKSRERFLSFIAETAVFNGGTPDEWRGHAAIYQGWSRFFEKDGPTLTWQPTRADVLVGGDVGVSIGSWIRRGKTPDGKATETRGQYVTTWLKQKDGSWKVVFDIGSAEP